MTALELDEPEPIAEEEPDLNNEPEDPNQFDPDLTEEPEVDE